MIVTVKDIERRCYELRDEFNATCDPKAYFMLCEELDFYSDVYKNEYGFRPRGFYALLTAGLSGRAKELSQKYESMSWEELDALKDQYLGAFPSANE